MAGVGKILKQAQKMQRKMESLQEDLAARQIEVSSGGGAVQITITGSGVFQKIALDPEFLKEDAELVQDTLLAAVQEAADKAKAMNEEEMAKISSGFQLPGMM